MSKTIRIGTRGSQLALWQATQVQQLLSKNDFSSEIIKIKSEGDLNLTTPLYAMGVQGVFTRHLDAALLTGQIDIAVHSMKDVPTIPAKGIVQVAVLKRGAVKDLLVYKGSADFLRDKNSSAMIATGSIRRKAQWLHRFPHHQIVDLRGNVNTRLKKLEGGNWNGAIFAAAGLERINLRPENSIELEWMLPAPAQGAILVASREGDDFILRACRLLNDKETEVCTKAERDFLRTLLGGCSTPISAYAFIKGNYLHFEGNILTTDGSQISEIKKIEKIESSDHIGQRSAEELLSKGGREILATLKV